MTVTPVAHNQTVSIDVRGIPRPQGSLRFHTLPGGKVASRYPAETYRWRGQMQQAVADATWDQFVGPVEVRLGFDMPRLASHWLPVGKGTKRSSPELREDAPLYPTTAPDIDKLVRAVLDSCTDAGLWGDDSQVAVLHAAKRYGDLPGVLIQVTAL